MFAGEQAGEFFGGAFDGVCRPEERGGPGVVAQSGPRRLGYLGGGDRAFEVVDRVNRGLADNGARGGVDNGPAFAGGRGD